MIERQSIRHINRVRAGYTADESAAPPWRPVTSSWIDSSGEQRWRDPQAQARGRLEGNSWISIGGRCTRPRLASSAVEQHAP
jgi:hypothetical protein